MARLPVIDPSDATGTAKEAFDGPLSAMPINIFKGMANSQAGLPAYLGLAGALGHSSFGDKEKEAIALVVGAFNGCDYCTAAHTMLGTKAGLSEDQTVALRSGSSTGDDKIDALATFTRRILDTKGYIEDADLQSFKGAGYDDASVVDVTVAIALNTYTNFFNHVNDTMVDMPAPPVLA